MKTKLTPKLLLILLATGILLWAVAPADTDRRAAASRLIVLPQSEEASLVGRGLALDGAGQPCGMSTDDPTCRTCDEETTPTFFTAQSDRQSHTNGQAVSVSWQVFHVTAAGWTNLCDADRANIGADQDGCDYTGAAGQAGVLTGGAMWLRPDGGTAHYNVIPGQQYAQKIYVCADPAPRTCTDTDYTILTSLTKQYQKKGLVTVTLAEGEPRRWPDFCRPDGLLDERVCGTTKTVQTSTIDCATTFGTTWTCTEGACAETGLVPGTHGGPITTNLNSETGKTEIFSGGIPVGTTDPKPLLAISDFEHLNGPDTWASPTSPVCIAAWGDGQCQAGGTCLQAVKPDCGLISWDRLTDKCAKTDANKVFVALRSSVPQGTLWSTVLGAAGLIVGGLIPGVGPAIFISELAITAGATIAGGKLGSYVDGSITDAQIRKFGICVPEESGFFGGFIKAFADLLGVEPGTATLILLGGGFVLLLLLFMPRRN